MNNNENGTKNKEAMIIPSVEKWDLNTDAEDFKGFLEDWKATFAEPDHSLYSYNAHSDPPTALSVIHDTFAFAVKWLPRELMGKLMTFPYDPQAPSALLIRGLPMDETVPPTPVKTKIHLDSNDKQTEGDIAWAEASTHVPVAETWLLGIGRLLGTLQTPPFCHGERGGLINDMIPVIRGNYNELVDLRMHRDFPRQLEAGEPESDMFLLLAARGDPQHRALTVVADSRKLLARLDPNDVQLLQDHPIQVQKQTSPNEPPVDYGSPFCAIEKNDMINLVLAPNQILVSPTGGDAIVQAYQRLEALAWEFGERIDLQQGDLLLLNNCRCVHGRTAYKPQMDGTDRWLLKSYVNSQLWSRPGTGAPPGIATYPNFTRSKTK